MTENVAIQQTNELVDQFRAVLVDAGLLPGDVQPDGVDRRCPTLGHPKKANGWYVMHPDGRGGAYQNHESDGLQFWTADGEPLPPADRARLRKQIATQRAEYQAKTAKAHQMATNKARQYLDGLDTATAQNPYLKKKGVKPCPGLKADGQTLIVPIFGADGKSMSYQKINTDGSKRFAPGAPVAGGFFAVGPKRSSDPLLISEGLATGLSLYEATGWPCLVAFSTKNIEAIAKLARSRYPSRRIIICGDNDIKTAAKIGKNPGVDNARAAALAIGGQLSVPSVGGDFNDLAISKGLGEVKAAIEAAHTVDPGQQTQSETEADKWPAPMPLVPDEKPEAYPADALPDLMGAAVGEVTAFVQCSPALTALAALGAASTVTAGLVDVKRADKLIGPTGLFFLAVADSGERKTTVDQFFTKAIRTWEIEREEEAKPEMQDWRAAIAAWTAIREGIINAIREASRRGKYAVDLEGKLADHEGQKPERPTVPRLLVCDTTSEALTWRLADLWPVAGLLSSEAGVILGGHAMKKDGIMKNLATLNSFWDGQPLRVDRRTSESYSVRSARLTLNLAVQPVTIRQFIDSTQGLARGSGFLARFLFAWPESTQGHRPFREAPEHWPALSQYHRRLSDLLDHPISLDDFGQLDPVVLNLDLAAKEAWIKFYNDVERELAPAGDLSEARDVASKAGDNAARMAALFHVFEYGPVGSIGADHMQRAARIVTWHLYEARRFLNQLAIPEAVVDALALEAWLIQKCKADHLETVPIADIQQKGPNRTRRKFALEPAMNELEQCYRVKRMSVGRKGFVRINPALLT